MRQSAGREVPAASRGRRQKAQPGWQSREGRGRHVYWAVSDCGLMHLAPPPWPAVRQRRRQRDSERKARARHSPTSLAASLERLGRIPNDSRLHFAPHRPWPCHLISVSTSEVPRQHQVETFTRACAQTVSHPTLVPRPAQCQSPPTVRALPREDASPWPTKTYVDGFLCPCAGCMLTTCHDPPGSLSSRTHSRSLPTQQHRTAAGHIEGADGGRDKVGKEARRPCCRHTQQCAGRHGQRLSSRRCHVRKL